MREHTFLSETKQGTSALDGIYSRESVGFFFNVLVQGTYHTTLFKPTPLLHGAVQHTQRADGLDTLGCHTD